jgi:hypothetical protein
MKLPFLYAFDVLGLGGRDLSGVLLAFCGAVERSKADVILVVERGVIRAILGCRIFVVMRGSCRPISGTPISSTRWVMAPHDAAFVLGATTVS